MSGWTLNDLLNAMGDLPDPASVTPDRGITQAHEAVRQLADVLGEYRRALMQNGFPDDDIFEFVSEYHRAVLGAAALQQIEGMS
jgi:hypothetical protein